MIYEIRKKLIHFYTQGNITEDYVSSRRVKVNKFRRIIRAGFYFHCAASVIATALSIVFGAGLAIIPIVICLLLSVAMSLLAVGDLKPVKIASIGTDGVFAVIFFIVGGISERKAPYIVCGLLMTLDFLVDLAVLAASLCKSYLEGVSPLMVRREDYTLLRSLTDEEPPDEEEITPLPQLTSEMRELARRVADILRTESESVELPGEIPPEISAEKQPEIEHKTELVSQ